MPTGEVRMWSGSFGWIAQADGPDLYVHEREVAGSQPLEPGCLVEYEVVETERGAEAANVIPSPHEPSQADAPSSYEDHLATHVSNDVWTVADTLGHGIYADAIAAFIQDPNSAPPYSIAVRGPWGAGKTSLMRMVRARLDPDITTGSAPETPGPAATGRDATHEAGMTNADLLGASASGASDRGLGRTLRDPADDRRVTVWFNAWKYQTEQQVWAGLAYAILDEVTRRLPRIERERFWMNANLRRVNPSAIRRAIYRAFAVKILPLVVMLPFAAATTVLLWMASEWAGAGFVTAVTASGLVAALHGWRSHLAGSVAASVPEIVRDPGYENQLGFVHLVHEDLHRLLGQVTTPSRPLVIFIDDLDRCAYGTVGQVVEALNTIISGELPNTVIIMAVEPDLLAAQIGVAYEKLFERMATFELNRGDLGWRFLEKLVQLPIAVPPADASRIEHTVDDVLRPALDRHAAPLLEPARTAELRRLLRAAAGPDAVDLAGAFDHVRLQLVQDGQHDSSTEAHLRVAARQEFVTTRGDEAARRLMVELSRSHGVSPRELKRLVNVMRFYSYVDFWRATEGLPSLGLAGVAKLARLTVGWPHLTRILAHHRPGDRERSLLARLEEVAAQRDQWDQVLVELPASVQEELKSSDTLRQTILRLPLVGDLAHAYM